MVTVGNGLIRVLLTKLKQIGKVDVEISCGLYSASLVLIYYHNYDSNKLEIRFFTTINKIYLI